LFWGLCERPPPPPQVRLEFHREPAAQSCPDEEQLRLRVAERLGYDPFTSAAEVRLVVRMERAPRQWRARIERLSPEGALGRRELTSDSFSCVELAAALELALALAIDPLGQGRHAPAPSAPPPAPPGEPEPAGPPVPAGEAPPRAPSPPGWSLTGAVGAGAAAGTAPSWLWGPWLQLRAARSEAFAWGGETALWLQSRAPLPGAGSVSSSGVVAALTGCVRSSPVELCGGGSGGVLWVEGEGLAVNRHRAIPRASALLRGGVERPLRAGLSLRLFAGAELAWQRTTLVLGQEQVWVTPALGGHAGAAVGFGL
jgi:hypothetical protein